MMAVCMRNLACIQRERKMVSESREREREWVTNNQNVCGPLRRMMEAVRERETR